MSYLTHKLKFRIDILQGVDTPNSFGALSRSYKKLITIWAGKKELSRWYKMVRAQNTDSNSRSNIGIDTDEFIVRYTPVVGKFERAISKDFSGSFDSNKSDGLGKEFDCGFDEAFDSFVDIYPFKSDYFVFLRTNTEAYRGRLYRINNCARDDEYKEAFVFNCTFVEEQGLGAVNG